MSRYGLDDMSFGLVLTIDVELCHVHSLRNGFVAMIN
jgi:hypothetical protein